MNRTNQRQIMTTQLPPPEREAFDREIHDLFKNGDLSGIARYLQKDQGQVSKSFNAFDETRHSPVYEFLRHLWAMDCIRESLADAVLSAVTREREKWLPDFDVIDAPAKLTGNVGKQYAEAVEAELDHASLDTQIREWSDVRDTAQQKIDALISERTAPLRQWAKAVVNGNGNGRR